LQSSKFRFQISDAVGQPHPSAAQAAATIPGPTGPFSLKTVHWTVFQALEPTKPAEKRLELQPNSLELATVAF